MSLLTDRLIMTVGGATALAACVYTTREGARVTWGYINRMLGQPSLIQESSMGRFLLAGSMSQLKNIISGAPAASSASPFDNVILHPSLKKRIEHLARATLNTKSHQAPFRNMMFYGPPGTGKTMLAREIARKSGLDYAMMRGGVLLHWDHKLLLKSIRYLIGLRTRTKVSFNNRKERAELLEAVDVSNKDATIPHFPRKIHLLWGESDQIFDFELARNMKEQLSDNATIESIKKTGHLVQLERPCVYNRHLKKFLASIHSEGDDKTLQ